jgi:hypothetical protein
MNCDLPPPIEPIRSKGDLRLTQVINSGFGEEPFLLVVQAFWLTRC